MTKFGEILTGADHTLTYVSNSAPSTPITGDLWWDTDDTTGITSGNADTVDNFNASATPTANTLLALDANSLFPTAAISGSWTAYTPTLTGFSSDPTGGTYRYSKVGKWVALTVTQPTNGTSNATTFTISLPFTAASDAISIAAIVNNTVDGMGVARITSTDYTVLKVYNALDNGYGTWTASGSKACRSTSIVYESA